MKRLSLFFLMSLTCYAHAQNIEGQIVASQFGEFKVESEGNGFAFDPATCNVSGGGKNFPAFSTNTPLKIVDSNPAQTETAIPGGVSITGSYCTVSLATIYTHTSFYLTSGTGGLQEAISNSKFLAGGPNTVILNAEWYELVSPENPASVIASVTGGSGFGLVDVTTTPYTYYQWNGSQYVAISTGGDGVSFPASPGIVYSSDVSSATNATSSEVATVLNTSPLTLLIPGVLPVATASAQGIVKPDGTTITVTNGVISSSGAAPSGTHNQVLATPNGSSGVSSLRPIVANDLPAATTSSAGAVIPDGTTIKITGATISAASTLPNATGSGQAPVSTGSGSNYTAQSVILPSPSGSQTIAQPGGTQLHLNNVTVDDGLLADSFTVDKINSVFYVDGNLAPGINQPGVPWASGMQYGQCQEVSHAGGNYILAAKAGDNSTTPGTNSNIWYPVTNGSIPTQLDCTFYIAAASIVSGTGTIASNGVGASIIIGNGVYYTNIGLTEPTVSSPGQPVVNIFGQGRANSVVWQGAGKSDGLPVLYQPPTLTPYAFASFKWVGFSVDAKFLASAVAGIYGAQQFIMQDMILSDATNGSDHAVELGDASDTPHGWTFEPYLDNIDLGTGRGFGTGAEVTATVSGGVPSFTIVGGGSGYDSATTQVILGGTSNFGRACSSPGTTTATINGSGVITAITSTATGCAAPLLVIIYGGAQINYGYKFSNTTDAKHISDLTNGGVGWIAGMYIADIDVALKIYNYHPESVLQGVLVEGSADFYSMQCDTMFQYCANIQGAGTVTFHSPFFEWNNQSQIGARDYLFLNPGGGIPGYNEPQAVNIENETCATIPAWSGYAHFDSSAGVIDSAVGSDSATLPAYVHAVNPQYCNQIGIGYSPQNADPTLVGQNIQMSNGAVGNNWNFNLPSGPLNGGSGQTMTVTNPNSYNTSYLGVYTWNFQNPTASTSSNNYNSPLLDLEGTYWNGTASTPFGVGQQLSFAAGSNAAATYTFLGNLGTTPSGGLTFQFNSPTAFVSGLYGGNSNQFQVNNLGQLSTTANVYLNGTTTAVTQASGDDSTKIATDAFVLANSGGGGVSLTPSGPQAVTQPGSGALTVNDLNDVYYVNGFTSTGYPGIGGAQTAWSSGTYPLCTAVSYLSANYLAVGVTAGITPGTNPAIWWQVNNANTPTQTDCAFYYTLAQASAAGSSYTLKFGDNTYSAPYTTAIGLAEPNSQTQVNLIGVGRGFNNQLTTLKATTSIGNGWVISAPDKTGSLPYNLIISGMNIDGGGLALGCLSIYGEKVGYIEHIGCVNWNPTSTLAIPVQIGDGSSPYQNGGYQFLVDDVFVAGAASALSNRALVSAAVASGSPSFTVSSGGSYINIPNRAYLWGFGAGASPCTTMGTLSTTYSGSGPYVLTGVTASGFSGCTGTLYAYVPDLSAAPYGMDISLMSDGTFRDLVVANAGWKYGIFWNGSSSNQITHEHVYGDSQTQIVDGNTNAHEGAELDTPVQIGASSSASATWTDTTFVNPILHAGVTGFYMGTGGNILQSVCGNTSTSSNLFNLVVTSSGPVAHGGNFGSVNVVDGQECDTLARENSNAGPLTTALASASTAVTQAAGDNTAKIATDAFVQANASPAAPQTIVLNVTGTTYYVDNINGLDTNSGTTPSTAWKTIAHVNAATIASGAQVLFLSTDVWHEQLNATAGVRYSWYGPQRNCSITSALVAHCTQMPIIDGADGVTTWTLVSGTTYSSPYTSTASKGFVDALYHQETPLALQTSLANVESTAGSIYSNGTLAYVNLLDGSNPANHVIEVSGSRNYGIELGGAGSITIDGLEIVRAAKSGIASGSSAAGNNVSIQNSVLFNTGDSLGDNANQGYGAGNAEAAIFVFPGFGVQATGWNISGNWIGQMDLPQATLNYTTAGIQFFSPSSAMIQGNKVATMHGIAIQVHDENHGGCTSPSIISNEIVNSEGAIGMGGCSGDYVVNNNIHDSFGNAIEIGGGFQSADQNNPNAYLAHNTFHDLTPAYTNGYYNGIDVNHAINGIATGNICYKVAAGCMTLEADAGPSSGWQIYGNTFDQSQGTGYNGTTPTSSSPAYPMYVRDTSLAGGLTMRANTLVFNTTTPIVRWGATSASDTTHDLSQAAFDAAYPNYETAGTGVQTAAAFNLQSGAAGPYTTFFDDFYTGANMASDPIGSPAADSCSTNTTYTDNNHPGNMLLTAGTGGTGTGIVCGLVSESASITSANTALGWTWETAVYVPVLPGTTAGAYQAGMSHTPNASPWTTGIGFYLSSANGVTNDWYCRYNSTSTDSGVAATVAWTRLTMVNDGTNVHWYIGGTQVCGTGVAIANMPSTTQYPAVWSATALSATSVTMAYDYINWQRAVSR